MGLAAREGYPNASKGLGLLHTPLVLLLKQTWAAKAYTVGTIESWLPLDQAEFNELHAGCVSAFKLYVSEAETTAMMLADCTAEPLPLARRLQVLFQEQAEHTAHSVYLAAKRLLHDAARLGYALSG